MPQLTLSFPNGDGTVSAVAALAPKRAAPKNRASQVAKDDNDDDQPADEKTTVALEAQPQPSGASLASIAVDGLPSAISTRLSEKSTPATIFTAPSSEYNFFRTRCKTYKKQCDVNFICRKREDLTKNRTKCKGCNRLDGRMATICNNSGAGFKQTWDKLDNDGIACFMRRAADLQGEALADEMNLTLEMVKTTSSKVTSGYRAKFWPLNYYREVLKFDTAQINGIEEGCEKQFDPVLKCYTYAYDVDERSKVDTDKQETRAAFRPRSQEATTAAAVPDKTETMPIKQVAMPAKIEQIVKKADGDRTRKREVSSSSSTYTSHGGDGKRKGKKNKKKRKADKAKGFEKQRAVEKRKAESAKTKEEKELKKKADEVVGKVGPLLTRIQGMTTRNMAKYEHKLPSFIVDGARTMQTKLSACDSVWKPILAGSLIKPVEAEYSYEEVMKLHQAGTSLANDLDVMISIAMKSDVSA